MLGVHLLRISYDYEVRNIALQRFFKTSLKIHFNYEINVGISSHASLFVCYNNSKQVSHVVHSIDSKYLIVIINFVGLQRYKLQHG